MKKVINIALDIETLSRKENAAIISLAAVPFHKNGEGDSVLKYPFEWLDEEYSKMEFAPFYEVVNATSCAMVGMDFEPETVKFWSEQEDMAKAEFSINQAHSIRDVLEGFVNYIIAIKEKFDVDVCIWCQGTDFDMPIICNAIRNVLQIKEVPWRYNQIRDSRTWILEAVELIHGELEDSYSVLPQNDKWTKHSALSDAIRLAENVAAINRMLRENILTN